MPTANTDEALTAPALLAHRTHAHCKGRRGSHGARPACPRDASPLQRQTRLSRRLPRLPTGRVPTAKADEALTAPAPLAHGTRPHCKGRRGSHGARPACGATTDTLSSTLGVVSLLARMPHQRGTLALILTQSEIIYRPSRWPQKSACGWHEGSFTHKDTLYLPAPCRERPGTWGSPAKALALQEVMFQAGRGWSRQ